MADEVTCAVCGAPLSRGPEKVFSSNPRVTRPGDLYCSVGHTETTDYAEAREARASGGDWSPREPSHCGVSMIGGPSQAMVNGERQWDYTCQICRHHERRPKV